MQGYLAVHLDFLNVRNASALVLPKNLHALISNSAVCWNHAIFTKSENIKRNHTTLDSGIDVAPGINVAHGTFGKNIKHSP